MGQRRHIPRFGFTPCTLRRQSLLRGSVGSGRGCGVCVYIYSGQANSGGKSYPEFDIK